MIIKIYNLQLNYKNESYSKRYYITYFCSFFQIIKDRTPRFPNPGKPFMSILSPETMEKYNGPAKPKCKSLDYTIMLYIIVKIYNKLFN